MDQLSVILSPLPPSKGKFVRVGVMLPDGSIEGDSGATIIYADSPLQAIRLLRKDGGYATAILSGGIFKWVSLHHKGRTIYPTGKLSADSVLAWRDYCYGRGIAARSLQGMGFYLMRDTLAGRMYLDEGNSIPMGIFTASPHLYAREGVYENMYQSDIRGAYLSALLGFSPVSEYSRIGRTNLREVSRNVYPGAYYRVRYRVGSIHDGARFPYLSQNGAVPRRWGGDRVVSANDLRTIAALGWDVRIGEGWIPSKSYPTPFSEFGNLISELRSDRFMGSVAKIASNTVWGSFTAGSGIQRLTFPGQGKHPKTTALPPRNKLCQPLAFSIISEIRERISLEGMGEQTVHAHTDGIISKFPLSTGEEIGDWRTVGFYDRVDIVRPSCYALTVDGQTTYKVAGRSGSDESTRRMFRERLSKHGY